MIKNQERLQAIVDSCVRYGKERTSINYRLPIETLNRYIREAKSLGITTDIADSAYTRKPNVLIIDIETAPLKAFVWGAWKQNIYLDQIINNWFMLTWSAKWLFESEIYSDKLTAEEAKAQDDKRLAEGIWKFIDHADVVIAHNGDSFDLTSLNTRFLMHGMTPPSSYQSIDTLKVARKQFRFTMNKLDFIARQLGVGRKIPTDFQLWIDCYEGDADALRDMELYNKQDVAILEDVYVKLRPWIKSHPNMNLFYDDIQDRCPTCGSVHLHAEGSYATQVSVFTTFRCEDCGSIGRARSNSLSKAKMGTVLASVAR